MAIKFQGFYDVSANTHPRPWTPECRLFFCLSTRVPYLQGVRHVMPEAVISSLPRTRSLRNTTCFILPGRLGSSYGAKKNVINFYRQEAPLGLFNYQLFFKVPLGTPCL
jgi:hypothetical protein